MILRVTGLVGASPDKRGRDHPQTKYYKPQENKEKVKRDFGIMLNAEIRKLHIDILI